MKYLDYKIIKKDKRNVFIIITKQEFRESKFFFGEYFFKSSNEIFLKSVTLPESILLSPIRTLFVQGYDNHYDDIKIQIPKKNFSRSSIGYS